MSLAFLGLMSSRTPDSPSSRSAVYSLWLIFTLFTPLLQNRMATVVPTSTTGPRPKGRRGVIPSCMSVIILSKPVSKILSKSTANLMDRNYWVRCSLLNQSLSGRMGSSWFSVFVWLFVCFSWNIHYFLSDS